MSQIEIDPKFLNIFAGYFNPDVIDLENKDSVKNAAFGCAKSSIKEVSDLDKLVANLSGALEQWDNSTIMLFIKASDTDWLFNEHVKQILKGIITQIRNELKSHLQYR